MLNPQFNLPESNSEWLLNLTLLPVFNGSNLLVPVSGALSIEVAAYILIPLMAIHKSTAFFGIIVSIISSVYLGFETESFPYRYSTFLPCLMSFSLGSLICKYREKLKAYASPFFSIFFWCAHSIIWIYFSSWPWTYGMYTSLILSAWVVLSLAFRKSNRIDRFLGDLSYPIYLWHTTIGIWLFVFFEKERSFFFFFTSFSLTLFISYLTIRLLEAPISRLKVGALENVTLSTPELASKAISSGDNGKLFTASSLNVESTQ